MSRFIFFISKSGNFTIWRNNLFIHSSLVLPLKTSTIPLVDVDIKEIEHGSLNTAHFKSEYITLIFTPPLFSYRQQGVGVSLII
jgi:hypothetical protein